MKKKMDPIKKVKLIYSCEIGVFVIVALTLGTLFLTKVLDFSERRGWVLSIIGLAGGLWFIADFIWALCSKKHRVISSLFDKAILFPSGLGMLAFDICIIVNAAQHGMATFEENYPGVFHIVIGAAFCYLAAAYLAEIIYHWYRPLPALLETSDKIEAAEKEAQGPVEEKPEDESK